MSESREGRAPTPRETLDRIAGPGAVACAWLGIASQVPARIAAASGLRLGVVDREHGAIGVETAAAMVAALKAAGAAALVRVPDHAKPGIQQALDAGADGLVIPQVESAAEAEAAVARALYPPLGRRGAAAGVIAATRFGADPGYQAAWNASALLACQIESRAGLAAAGEIAAVPGVSMLFFGPFDYASDAGLDPARDAPRLAEAFAEVTRAARASGRLVGVFPWPGRDAAALAAEGADLVAAVSDIAALGAACRAAAL